MTKETEELFDSPWVLFSDPDNEVFQIESNSGNFIAELMMFKDARRIVLFPELYDALMEACGEYCPELKHDINHCENCGGEDCKAKKWVKLLKKVR